MYQIITIVFSVFNNYGFVCSGYGTIKNLEKKFMINFKKSWETYNKDLECEFKTMKDVVYYYGSEDIITKNNNVIKSDRLF